MSQGISTTGQQRTITAFFDSRQDANEAADRLVSAGVTRSDIRIVEGSGSAQGSTGTQGTVSGRSYPDEGTGFWDALKDLFLPDEDRQTYAEGLRRGGYLLTVRVTQAQYDRAIDILDDEGTVNMDERESTWRSEGWSGYSSGRGTGSTATGLGATGLGTTGSTSGSTTARTGTGASGQTSTARSGEEVIPVGEEQLRVGKREVNQGRVRVRSYVVEQPVQEQVNLRQEHVSVERRPTTGTATTGTDNLFKDRTIEVNEKSEEAVVSKEARVREELVVNKNVENRTETVNDTVRKTEVEVEDERGNRVSGTTGTTGDRNR